MTDQLTIGFIGLGVMGEPMCRNLARKSGASAIAFDLRPEPLARLKADGVKAATSAREMAFSIARLHKGRCGRCA